MKEAGGRRGADTTPFSIMKLLHIGTAISWKLTLIRLLLKGFWLNMQKYSLKLQTLEYVLS